MLFAWFESCRCFALREVFRMVRLVFAPLMIACAALLVPIRQAEARATARLGGDCVTAAPVCEKPASPAPCITYRYRGCRDVCCGCPTPIQSVLQVKNPCTCCV